MSRARAATRHPLALIRRERASGGDERVEAFVSLAQTALHAARGHAVARLDRGIHGVDLQPRAAAPEVFERHRLDGDDVGEALELERLDGELVLADGVEGSVEPPGLALGV